MTERRSQLEQLQALHLQLCSPELHRIVDTTVTERACEGLRSRFNVSGFGKTRDLQELNKPKKTLEQAPHKLERTRDLTSVDESDQITTQTSFSSELALIESEQHKRENLLRSEVNSIDEAEQFIADLSLPLPDLRRLKALSNDSHESLEQFAVVEQRQLTLNKQTELCRLECQDTIAALCHVIQQTRRIEGELKKSQKTASAIDKWAEESKELLKQLDKTRTIAYLVEPLRNARERLITAVRQITDLQDELRLLGQFRERTRELRSHLVVPSESRAKLAEQVERCLVECERAQSERHSSQWDKEWDLIVNELRRTMRELIETDENWARAAHERLRALRLTPEEDLAVALRVLQVLACRLSLLHIERERERERESGQPVAVVSLSSLFMFLVLFRTSVKRPSNRPASPK